ncbi:energy-coupling factor transporter transmembrane component T [Dysosmobacter sp.]
MGAKDAFSGYHPLVSLVYFALVLAFTMVVMHPLSLMISWLGGLTYAACLYGWRAVAAKLRGLFPMLVTAAIVNPAFQHRGVTVLAYFPSGNPLTLESILYGLGAAGMLAAAVTWFFCCTAVMTTDKFVELFGRAAPSLSLVLSMTLRFVPRFRRQFHAVARAQRGLGRDVSDGGPIRRLRLGAAIVSAVVTWSLENAAETADSMKSRGYGLSGRTSFSIYRIDGRDKAALVWLLGVGGFLCFAALRGALSWRYYPAACGAPLTALFAAAQGGYLALCLTPAILHGREKRKWKRLQSEI